MPSVLELQDTMSYYDVEGYRVQLIATVFRNLVVNSSINSAILGQDPDVLRFVCLCIYSRHNSLHQLGLDILSFLHFPVVGTLVPVLKRLLDELLHSPDRVDVARGLRILRHLCESPLSSQQDVISGPGVVRRSYVIDACSRNFSFLLTLPASVYSALMRIIYLRDLHLLILALDAVFALSSQGPLLCKLLLGQTDETFFLDTLIAHLTFEPQSFGSESLIRMRVMQVPGMSLPSTTSSVKTTASRSKDHLPELSKSTKFVPMNDLTSGLLLAPLPQPPTGCFAVPVSIAKSVRPIGITNEPEVPDAPSKKTNAAPRVSLPPTTQWTTSSTAAASVTSTSQAPIVLTSQASSLVAPVVCYTSESTSSLVTTHHAVLPSQAKVSKPTPPQSLAEPPVVAVNGKPQPALSKSCETKGAKTQATSGPIYVDAPKDRREFAMFWLNKNYQVHPQSSFPRVQIYADYQKAHQQNLIPGSALSAGEFHVVIKSMFPLVDQVKVLVPNGNVEIHYNKLKHVDAPEPLEQALAHPVAASVLLYRLLMSLYGKKSCLLGLITRRNRGAVAPGRKPLNQLFGERAYTCLRTRYQSHS
ncbi:unnamed protein product, partial [Dibothriocephalus latus]